MARFEMPRPSIVAALGTVLVFAGLVLAERQHLLTLPSPSDQLVAAVLPGAVVALTNEERKEEGLGSLKANALLNEAAQLKADDMAAKGYYAHVSPDGTIPPYWLNKVGYRYQMMGENLVVDRENSEAVVSAWMGSVSHRENLLNPQHTEIGVGVAHGTYKGRKTIYVVQMLARPTEPARPVPKPKVTIPAPVAPTKPLLPKPVPVKTAATTSTLVRPRTAAPVVRDALTPVLTAVASTTLVEVPNIVASTSFTPPIIPPFVSPPVELTSTTADEPVRPRLDLRGKVRTFVHTLGSQIKSVFSPLL